MTQRASARDIAEARVRRIEFDALFNFRDLGGYPAGDGAMTRWGVLYRADGLHRATPGDLDRLEELGITTVIDLRTPAERDEDGSFDRRPTGIDYHHVPLFDDLARERPDVEADDYLLQLYRYLVIARGDRIARALRLVSQTDGPAVFHCTAGKDRTGVLASLILAALGAPDDVIAQDYALSNEAMVALIEWYRARRSADTPAPIQTTAALNRVGAEAPWMHDTLRFVRTEYGSIEAYLNSIDFGAPDLEMLKRRLLV